MRDFLIGRLGKKASLNDGNIEVMHVTGNCLLDCWTQWGTTV